MTPAIKVIIPTNKDSFKKEAGLVDQPSPKILIAEYDVDKKIKT